MRISDHTCKYFKSNDILNSFLADVRKYPVPTVEREEELFENLKNGDESARDELILGNLRFIYSLAKIYARNESEVVDYVNEGVIGLLIALNEFDSNRGYKFITYGVWYIRRQMNYYMLTKRDIISHSSQVGNIIKKSDSFRQKYYAEHGSMPTNEEVKAALLENFNISVSKEEDLFEAGLSSIDEEISDDYSVEDTSEFNSKTCSANGFEAKSDNDYLKEILKEYLEVLPERLSDIIKMKYGVDYEREYSDEEIADKYCIDVDQVRKLCEYAIAKMQKVPVKHVI